MWTMRIPLDRRTAMSPVAVVAGVVDDPDVRLRQDGPQVVDRPADHLFLVERGHEQVPVRVAAASPGGAGR